LLSLSTGVGSWRSWRKNKSTKLKTKADPSLTTPKLKYVWGQVLSG
jgi:hypothetical protein